MSRRRPLLLLLALVAAGIASLAAAEWLVIGDAPWWVHLLVAAYCVPGLYLFAFIAWIVALAEPNPDPESLLPGRIRMRHLPVMLLVAVLLWWTGAWKVILSESRRCWRQ